MHRYFRPCIRRFSYLLLITVFLQLSTISPAAAQREDPNLPLSTYAVPPRVEVQPSLQLEPALTLSATSPASSLIIGETSEIILRIGNTSALSLSNVQLHVPYHPNVKFMDDNNQDLDSYIVELGNLAGNSEQSIPMMVQVFGDAPEFINLEFMVRSVESNSVKTTLTLKIDTSTKTELDIMAAAPSPESVTVDPASAWTLSYTPPGASEFTGGAQYSYPINVVPGAGGLTSDLALHYNGGGVDNIRPMVMSNGFGEGWSLPQAQITNGNAARMYTGEYYGGDLKNFENSRFSLELNGASYRLRPITTGRHGRYTAIGDPSLYIEFINGSSNAALTNVTGEYWLVRTADGTEYRFGFNEDAEQAIAPISSTHNIGQPRNKGFAAFSWKLDQITNTSGVNVKYIYQTACGYLFSTVTCRSGADYTEMDVALDRIEYNFSSSTGSPRTIIDFNYNQRNLPGRRETRFLVAGVFQPNEILIAHDSQTIKSYEFNYSQYSHNWDGLNFIDTEFWMLTSIEEFGRDGISSLPITTFQYEQDATKSCDNQNNPGESEVIVCIGLLTQVDNGYGGVTKLFYELVGDKFFRATDVYSWDGVEHVYNGINGSAATHIEYDRTNATACYDKDGHGCRSPFTFFSSGALVGFDQVTVRVYDPDPASANVVLNESKQTFNTTDYWLNGKLLSSITSDPITQKPITEQTNVWSWESTADSIFARLGKTSTFNYDLSGQANGIEVTYAYELYNQGDRQWGRVTGQTFNTVAKDVDGNISALKSYSTRTRYVTNENEWIIAPFLTRTLDNNDVTTARTFYLYDGSMDPDNQAPSRGRLTLTRVQYNFIDIDSGSTTVYETIDTQYSYDSFGNVQTATTYADYGQLGFASSTSGWTFWTSPGNGSPARISSTIYDSDGIHPIRTTNPLNHTTTISYDSEFPSLPTSVTDVDNNITTKYEYDPFGRLHAVYDQSDFSGFGDSDPWNGNPLTRYRYWDNDWNHSSQIWSSQTVYEVEDATYPWHLIGSDNGNGAWQSPAVNSGQGPQFMTFGPYKPPQAVGPGQIARFRLAVDPATAATNAIVAIIEVYHPGSQTVLASGGVQGYSMEGGLSNFSSFDLVFDTTGYANQNLEYRVYWTKVGVVAHEDTTIIWNGQSTTGNAPFDLPPIL